MDKTCARTLTDFRTSAPRTQIARESVENDGKPNPVERLKPYQWKKGAPSANPGGRPKGIAAKVKEKVGNNAEELIEFLFNVVSGVEKAKLGDRIDATKILLERGFGRPVDIQAHILAGDSDTADEVKQLASDALRALANVTAPKPSAALIDVTPANSDAPVTQSPLTPENDESPQGDT